MFHMQAFTIITGGPVFQCVDQVVITGVDETAVRIEYMPAAFEHHNHFFNVPHILEN